MIKNKTVLITGADGFIGSHLTERLYSEGATVKTLLQYNSFNNWGWLEDVSCKNDIEIITGDIRDSSYMKRITKNVDIIFHLAALMAIPYSYIAPESFMDTNIKGTLNICQAALENNVSKVIVTSTSEVYGTARYVPIDEEHPKQAQSPYSASKIAADAVAKSYFNTYQLPIVVARPFNTYGPRQSSRAVIPAIITQILSGQKEIRLGDTTPTRDFNYVYDTCSGFIELAKSDLVVGEEVNIGSNTEVSINDVFELIKKITKKDVCVIEDIKRLRPSTSEVMRLCCDNTKIKRLTNFSSRFSLEQGLRETIQWFNDPSNLKKYKAKIYNI